MPQDLAGGFLSCGTDRGTLIQRQGVQTPWTARAPLVPVRRRPPNEVEDHEPVASPNLFGSRGARLTGRTAPETPAIFQPREEAAPVTGGSRSRTREQRAWTT